MAFANLHFFQIFIEKSQTLFICKQDQRAAMDKEEFGLNKLIYTNDIILKFRFAFYTIVEIDA